MDNRKSLPGTMDMAWKRVIVSTYLGLPTLTLNDEDVTLLFETIQQKRDDAAARRAEGE